MRVAAANTARHVAAACAAIAALSALIAILASQDGWFRTSALVKMSYDEPLSDLALTTDPHFAFVNPQEHYDGVYYWAMAVDPFAQGQAHRLIDQASYRYSHPLHGWFAGLLSGGDARHVPSALLLLSLCGIALAAWAASRLSADLGASPWAGLLVAAWPGLLYATTVSTTEPLGAALVLLALRAWLHRRWTAALVLNVLCCLDKEPYIAVPIGLAVVELAVILHRRVWPAQVGRRALALATGPVVLGVWYVYVHATLHQWPSHYAAGNIGAPVSGWRETFRFGKALSSGSFDQSQIGAITAPVLIAVAALLVAGMIASLRHRTVLTAPLLLMVTIAACQSWRTLLYPHEIFRTPAVVALLAALALLVAQPRRKLNSAIADSAAARSAAMSGP